jgi:hypothetical protein
MGRNKLSISRKMDVKEREIKWWKSPMYLKVVYI